MKFEIAVHLLIMIVYARVFRPGTSRQITFCPPPPPEKLLNSIIYFLIGQLALKSSSALIVGVGGLGCPAGVYLAAAGLGTHIS